MDDKELIQDNLNEELLLEWEKESIMDKILNIADRLIVPVTIILTIGSIAFASFFVAKMFIDLKKLNSRSQELYYLSSYDTSILLSNSYTKNETRGFKEIEELIDYNTELENKVSNYKNYLWWIQAPYDNFLKYILLPSLNIWKDPFLWDIRDDFIWLKYLENNPYNDIELIDKWSNFIKDVWSSTAYNKIESIELWEIIEEWEEFYIPIRVRYVADSNRSFLLLVEKLSTTSNQKSISLINELIYYIWEDIKNEKVDEIRNIRNDNPSFTRDEAIWYNLYQWVKEWQESNLIDDEIIERAIKKVAQCSTESVEYCYYKFRNKYRNLPSLAYKIWFESNTNKTENLRKFLSDLPQIIKIVNFTYDDSHTNKDSFGYGGEQYRWTIEFKIYWDWVSDTEVWEIQNLLWNKCLWRSLKPETALEQVEKKLVNLWDNENLDTYWAINLLEIEWLVSDIVKSFDKLSNYKKVIKTFELYRMLSEWSVCDI